MIGSVVLKFGVYKSQLGSLLEMQILVPHPRPSGPESAFLTRSPGDGEAH